MKSIPSLVRLTTLVTVTVCLAFFAFRVNAQQSERATKISALSWEYKVVPWSEITWVPNKRPDQLLDQREFLELRLNEKFGKDGWELCGIDSQVYFFRRPK